jgi:hypothetical protein
VRHVKASPPVVKPEPEKSAALVVPPPPPPPVPTVEVIHGTKRTVSAVAAVTNPEPK